MNTTIHYLLLLIFIILPSFAKTQTILQWPTSKEISLSPNQRYYRLIKFRKLPSQKKINELYTAGIHLLEYHQQNSYLCAIEQRTSKETLAKQHFLSFSKTEHTQKISPDLYSGFVPDWARQKDHVLVNLKYDASIAQEIIISELKQFRVKILASNNHNNLLRVAIPQYQIATIAQLPYVFKIALVPPPSSADDQKGLNMHRANAINGLLVSDRHFDGTGVHVLCRDDGTVGPHIDFGNRLEQTFVDNTLNPGGTHADAVCGIIGGAGNINPRNQGMAPAATLYNIDYESDFLDETLQLHIEEQILVTNTSYSNGCNAGYTLVSETVDQQLFDYPHLMHVFSAGNSNALDCGYGAGNQWGNITGGHKQAKNCLTVGNLDHHGNLHETSSRGPAHDGRIKPDISAYGEGQVTTDQQHTYQVFGGTSSAAPGVTGVLAQLHQAYQELNNGDIAEAALLKAAVLNTADDKGNEGPDFKYGWGAINALKAVEVLEKKQYLLANIQQNETKQHLINVPAGVAELKAMIYWHDPEANSVTGKALINNLDFVIKDINQTAHLPWVLNTTADPELLDQPASKGIDDTNNMEQVSIKQPIAGNYTFEVSGETIPFGASSYYIVWEFEYDEVVLTYPMGGESIIPGESICISWDAHGSEGQFNIGFKSNLQDNFSNIAQVSGDQRLYHWEVPTSVIGQAFFKVTHITTGFHDKNEAPAFIAPVPNNIKVTKACPEFLGLQWDPVSFGSLSGTIHYDIFLMGDEVMEQVGTTTNLNFDIPTIDQDPTKDHWIAVRAKQLNSVIGERSIAILYNDGLKNCQQVHDLSMSAILSPLSGTIFGCGAESLEVVVAYTNLGQSTESNVELAYELNNGVMVSEIAPGDITPGETKFYTFNNQIDLGGATNVQLTAYTALASDVASFNNATEVEFSLALYEGAGESLDYLEDFENDIFPPQYFAIENPDNDLSWMEKTVVGINGQWTKAVYLNNYAYSSTGEEDILLTVPVDLTGADSPFLMFDLAYARYSSNYADRMKIEISLDCGQTFSSVIYDKEGETLATTEDHSQLFTPHAADEWRSEYIDLSSFKGHSVVFKFVNITGYGNAIYLDNIQVMSTMFPVASFNTSNTTICQGQSVLFQNESFGEDLSVEWQFGSTALPAFANESDTISVQFPNPGMYTVVLTVGNSIGASSFSQIIQVEPPAIPSFTYEINEHIATFINTSKNAQIFLWDFGDGHFSNESDPIHAYADVGSYPVVLTASNACGASQTSPNDLNILVNHIDPTSATTGVKVYPNPANYLVNIEVNQSVTGYYDISIRSINGQLMQYKSFDTNELIHRTTFDISTLSAGIYFIDIMNGKERTTQKLVIYH